MTKLESEQIEKLAARYAELAQYAKDPTTVKLAVIAGAEAAFKLRDSREAMFIETLERITPLMMLTVSQWLAN